MTRFFSYALLWLLLATATGCNTVADDAANADCASNFSATLIAQLSAQPKQNPVAEITQYTFQGQTVYLVTGGGSTSAGNSGNLNYLFDSCGNVLCAASGGPSGQGDGRCPNFQATATNPVLIWRDPR